MKVTQFEDSAAGAWDDLVERSQTGTLIHTRRFLGYHGDRFEDASVLLHDPRGRLVGVMPAAVDPADRRTVISHPGATYGGIVHDGSLVGPSMLDALAAVASHHQERGFTSLRYAPVPFIYHRQPSADDLYALFRLGGTRVRCDLSCAVDLDAVTLSSRRRRGVNNARRSGVGVAVGSELIEELWPVVEENLAERYGATPTHTAAEMSLLAERFPEGISVLLARQGRAAIAGVVLFYSAAVAHAQYIASTKAGNAVSALDAVFQRCFSDARARGARYFDFGTSNRDAGRVLNEGLYCFKAQFGGGGVAHEFYELDLARRNLSALST